MIGALVTGALSLEALAGLRLLGAVALYSRVPLEASDLESSTSAAARWRGGAMGADWRGRRREIEQRSRCDRGRVSELDERIQVSLMLFTLDAAHSDSTRFSALRAGRRGRKDIFVAVFGADGLRSEMSVDSADEGYRYGIYGVGVDGISNSSNNYRSSPS